LVSEDSASLDAIECHIRSNPNISDLEFSVVLSYARDFVSPLKMIRKKLKFLRAVDNATIVPITRLTYVSAAQVKTTARASYLVKTLNG